MTRQWAPRNVYLVDRIDPGESKDQVVALDGSVVFDFDARGKLLGIEILRADSLLRPETMEAAEVPGAGRG